MKKSYIIEVTVYLLLTFLLLGLLGVQNIGLTGSSITLNLLVLNPYGFKFFPYSA